MWIHVAATGVGLFDAVCAGHGRVVTKSASGRYAPEATTWVKIKNPRYSQAEARAGVFDAGGGA